MAHAALLRNNTTPTLQTMTSVGGLQKNAANASRASQLSGTTYAPSTMSLASVASTATVGAPQGVVATSNIINQRADASRSLYQICVSLRQRFAQVPDF